MIHLGDITKLNGAEIPVVDCITGGSPCQDLSVAGKRAGLKGERSGLFMEQVRIVREMRERDRARGRTGYMVRPRYMVWENVPGAFSSAKGEDFAAVVEEILKVCEPGASVSVRVPDRGWPKSGCYYAEDGTWSVAWRVHDAQFWGVPQRRKRIALVADFGGLSAPEVLFERKGLRGYFTESGTPWKGIAANAERGVGADDREVYNESGRGYWMHGFGCLRAEGENRPSRPSMCVVQSAGFKAGQGAQARSIGWEKEKTPTLASEAGGNSVPSVCVAYDARGNGNGATSPTLTGDHQNRVTDYTALCVGNGQLNQISMAEQANTLDTMHDQQAIIAFAQNSRNEVRLQGGDGQIAGAIASNEGMKQRTYLAYGLDSNKNGYQEQAWAIQAHTSGGATEFCADRRMTVRRLTPLECERLQGYPDGWTDIGEWTDSKGKKRQTTDTARYKALGNSIALPFWFWLLRRISAQYERPATLGSLFDGIGGFPLCWEQCNGKGTAIWASEIEEFPIAVTKRRFGDD